ncbi:acyltransferase [Sphingobacterium psychroaquaticum]|nr:acyltransferase [Sphingobacterium psychroaquaticum]
MKRQPPQNQFKLNIFNYVCIRKTMDNGKKTRDGSIDVLRSIGLLCIVLAHVVPPNWLFQIRNFDVPLMVFISGYLYAGRANQIQSFTSLLDYLGKRFVRLVVPVWIFLSLFYLIQYCFPSVFPINYTLFPDVMRSSYLLLEGFGYVWIIRVFLMMAILGPLSMVYFKKPISILYYYISYEVVYLLVQPYLGDGIGKQFNEILLYTAGFLVFFLLGSTYTSLTKSAKTILFTVTIALTALGGLYFYLYENVAFNIGSFKYPPRLFYMYYAVAICLFLFHLRPWLAPFNNRLITFIGSSTIWIYLWHILLLLILPIENWGIRFLVVFMLASTLTYVQQYLVEMFIRLSGCSSAVSKQLRIIFCS